MSPAPQIRTIKNIFLTIALFKSRAQACQVVCFSVHPALMIWQNNNREPALCTPPSEAVFVLQFPSRMLPLYLFKKQTWQARGVHIFYSYTRLWPTANQAAFSIKVNCKPQQLQFFLLQHLRCIFDLCKCILNTDISWTKCVNCECWELLYSCDIILLCMKFVNIMGFQTSGTAPEGHS